MSLFTVVLQVSRQEREILARLLVLEERQAVAEERAAVALESIAAKIVEETEDVPVQTFRLGPVREQ